MFLIIYRIKNSQVIQKLVLEKKTGSAQCLWWNSLAWQYYNRHDKNNEIVYEQCLI